MAGRPRSIDKTGKHAGTAQIGLRKEVARLGAFLHPVGMVINTEHGAVIPKAGIEGVTDEEVNEYLKAVRGD